MAPKADETSKPIIKELKTGEHASSSRQCACKRYPGGMPEKSKNARRCVSVFDLSATEEKPVKKSATLGSAPAIDGLGKSHKGGYSRLLCLWRRFKRSLSGGGSEFFLYFRSIRVESPVVIGISVEIRVICGAVSARRRLFICESVSFC